MPADPDATRSDPSAGAVDVVYLVLAHRDLDQLERLTRRMLRTGRAAVLIHVDRRVRLPPAFLDGVPADHRDRLQVTASRFRTDWGGFDLVLATLRMVELALAWIPSARYVSLHSGQDYPIKPDADLRALWREGVDDFMTAKPLRALSPRRGIHRIDRYHLSRNHRGLVGSVQRAVRLLPRRGFPVPIERVHIGSQWWSLRTTTARKMVDLATQRPELVDAFRWTFAPDEMVFPTLVVGHLGIRPVDWNARIIANFTRRRRLSRLQLRRLEGVGTFGVGDVPRLADTPEVFARKFDARADPAVLDVLDAF